MHVKERSQGQRHEKSNRPMNCFSLKSPILMDWKNHWDGNFCYKKIEWQHHAYSPLLWRTKKSSQQKNTVMKWMFSGVRERHMGRCVDGYWKGVPYAEAAGTPQQSRFVSNQTNKKASRLVLVSESLTSHCSENDVKYSSTDKFSKPSTNQFTGYGGTEIWNLGRPKTIISVATCLLENTLWRNFLWRYELQQLLSSTSVANLYRR